MSKLTQLIYEVVEQKTFSLDALQAIQDKAKEQETLLDLQNMNAAADTTLRAALSSELETARMQIRDYQQREHELQKREAAMYALEKSTAVAEARAAATLEVTKLVFANRVTRENILTRDPITYVPAGCSMPQTAYQGVERREEVSREEG